MEQDPIVDLAFPVTAGRVPMDHGYALYSSLVEPVPELHLASWLGVHPLSGKKLNDSTLLLTPMSAVTLRLPGSKAAIALQLAGRRIRIGGEIFLLGNPTLRPLEPSTSLFSRQVAIRLTRPPTSSDGALDVPAFREAFAAAAQRQLAALGVRGALRIVSKRQIAVKGQCIVAFAVEVSDLDRDDGLKLQARGIGGKRRMGCGVFRPSRIAGGAET